MKILLTNDDGYRSQGLIQLAHALCEKHEVYVVAPERENSGASHSLSFVKRLNCASVDLAELTEGGRYQVDVPCFAVSGSPADSVKFAIEEIYKDKTFDVVIAGVNTVLNIGTDTIYSGTFGAAEEASILGVKGIAVSTVNVEDDYSFPVSFVAENLEKIVSAMSPMVTVNINIPFAEKQKNKGVAVAPLGLRRYNDWYEIAEDGGYQLTGYTLDCANSGKGDDCQLVDQGYVTVTPVRVVSRDEDLLDEFKKLTLRL